MRWPGRGRFDDGIGKASVQCSGGTKLHELTRGPNGLNGPYWKRLLIGLALAWAWACAHGQSAPSGLEMRVLVQITRADGEPAEITLQPGGVLRTGDGVQVRVRTTTDAYVYVIAYGSSGSAMLLHPFSGNHDEARVSSGTEQVVPRPGVFIPLDRTLGQEGLFAISSSTPVEGLSRLLVRMESFGADLAAVERVVRREFRGATHLAFRHIGQTPLIGVTPDAAGSQSGGPRTVEARRSSNTDGGDGTSQSTEFQKILANLPADVGAANKGQPYEEQGVLSAEGSRIAALGHGGAPSPRVEIEAETKEPRSWLPGLRGSEESNADEDEESEAPPSLVNRIGSWFSWGSRADPEAENDPAAPDPEREVLGSGQDVRPSRR